MLDLYNNLESQIQSTYDSLISQTGNSRKEFAEKAKKYKTLSVPLFAICEDYANAHQFLALIEEKQFWRLWRDTVNK
jgi:hypothetical protein